MKDNAKLMSKFDLVFWSDIGRFEKKKNHCTSKLSLWSSHFHTPESVGVVRALAASWHLAVK